MLKKRHLNRLMENWYHLYQPVEELRTSPTPKALLDEWLLAKKPSQAWRKGRCLEQAICILAVMTDTERDVVEDEVYELVGLHAEPDEAAV